MKNETFLHKEMIKRNRAVSYTHLDVYKRQGYNKATVIYDNSDYGKGVSDVFTNSFTELGGEVLLNESYIGCLLYTS